MDPERRLVGLVLRPNEVVHVKSEFFEDLDGRDWALHITQAALTKDAEPGKNAICVVDDAGVKFVLAILEQGRCENSQVRTLLNFDPTKSTNSTLTGVLPPLWAHYKRCGSFPASSIPATLNLVPFE